MMFSLTL